ncbi:hypothetical protein REC12_09415 [Desulfosporosinus sp. PR]|uniref:hypothetical protein n=1 Tax=Candidatus Desulfosporosinus nitrosoreducens TaxID=3401928 RepID=UPI0027F8F317|nr:hypothetical protein [Desulfosporosinus sp. PR]MDQ7093809.1 hypothetical protein [Desulfosporosinus sp. PR]
MKKIFSIPKTLRKPSLLLGSLLLIAVLGVSGCGSSNANATQSTSQSQTDQSQAKQGQSGQGQKMRNPAQQAVMEIRRLQTNQQNPLTSDQKTKLKTILQSLISTTNPSQDFLQQQADAINAVFTDQQKSFLATPPQRPTKGNNKSSGNQENQNGQNNQSSQNAQTNPNGNNKQGGTNGQPRGSFNPSDFYKQVLDSLN